MGVFWRITEGSYLPVQTLILHEPRGTLSGSWPFLWRLGQYYHLLEDSTLRYHCLAHTPYIMVRVGPEAKRVWVENREKKILPLVYTGIRRAGLLVRAKDGVRKNFFSNTKSK